jgi:hypothetical protein
MQMNDSPADVASNPKVTIDWFRSTPWWRLASMCIVISWRATHILLCAAALLVTQLWVGMSHQLFSPESEVSYSWVVPQGGPNPIAPQWSAMTPDSLLTVWQHYMDPCLRWLQNPTLHGAAETVASMIGIIAIWSFVGGSIARRSIVELGTRLTATWTDTFMLVFPRWQSIAWSVCMPSALILMIAMAPLSLGWFSNIPAIGIWIAGLVLIPCLLFSLAIGWCGAITLFGFPLSVCAIVAEKQADAYDGISRSAAYTFQRPLTLALCVVLLQFLGLAGGSMLALVLTVGFSTIEAAFNIGSSAPLLGLESMWSPLVNGIVPLLMSAYGYSFFWTASAVTYLILRREVDHAEFDLIDMNSIADPKSLPELPKRESTTTIESADPETGAEQAISERQQANAE